MLLSIQQRYILELLRKLGAARREQLGALVRAKFQTENFQISQPRMDAMLRQLRMCVGEVRIDGELVYLHGRIPDPILLEAVDVMLEVSDGAPLDFTVKPALPALLRFTWGSGMIRVFTVALLTTPGDLGIARPAGGRTVWISTSGQPPSGLTLPPKHFFAARQQDGSHRFYGSTQP